MRRNILVRYMNVILKYFFLKMQFNVDINSIYTILKENYDERNSFHSVIFQNRLRIIFCKLDR